MPTVEELRIMQALPVDLKVKKTQLRIREWANYYGIENCAVAFSGGKDGTVLCHIVREMYPNIEAVFCNTGLEYPEIQRFAKSFPNVTVLYPTMSFEKVIAEYGYPFISKEVAERVHNARECLKSYDLRGGYRYLQHYHQLTGTFPGEDIANSRDWGFL